MTDNETARNEPGFTAKVLIVALTVVLLIAVWRVALVFLLGFGGIIVAVGLNNLSIPVSRWLRIEHHFALGIVTIAIVALLLIFLTAFGTEAAAQFSGFVEHLPMAWDATRTWLMTFLVGRWLLDMIDHAQPGADALVSAIPFASGLFNWLADAVLIMVLGVYLAADPKTYFEGAVRLFPPERRPRVRAIMLASGSNLRKWLIAMVLDALINGLIVGIGLWTVGAPFPLPLGVLSGVSAFVPYIGPIVMVIPGLLLALSASPMTALYAAIVYFIAHQIEANISLPILQRRTVHLPPLVSLLALVAFGLLFGLWGVLLATPLAVACMTVIQMAYVHDVLEKPVTEVDG